MSVGDHLEELRRRLIYGVVGFVVILVVCLFFGTRVILAFCDPLYSALLARDLNPQLFVSDVTEGFMTYVRISLISALALSAPWLLLQLWMFVAAGLYPHERRGIMRMAPLSLALLIAGMAFVYFIVLPFTIVFFIDFSSNIPAPSMPARVVEVSDPPYIVPAIHGDPANPVTGQMWYNTYDGRLKMQLASGEVRILPFGPSQLVAPQITLSHYISLVTMMLLIFGISFQLPLVVYAVARIGIVDTQTLRNARRYVYFALVFLSASITPGDVITVTLALVGPLILLYEFGILMADWSAKKARQAEAEEAESS